MSLRLALLLAVAGALVAQPAPGRLHPVVGQWGAAPDDPSALVVDGAAWSGRTGRDTLAASGRQLFGDASAPWLANGESANAFPLAVDRATRHFADGTLRVQFKLIAGPTDQSAGIVFGLQPDGTYHFVRYNTKDGNIALWGFARGERQVIAKGEGLKQLPLGEWHELVVQVSGREVRGAVTGHPELDARFVLAAPVAGRVGLWAKRDVVTAFRRFQAGPASP